MHRIYIRTISIKVCKVVSVLLRLMADWFYLRRREVEFIADNKKPAEAGFLQDHSNILSVSPPGHGRSSLILCASCAAAVGSNLTEKPDCRTGRIALNPCKPFAIDDIYSHHLAVFGLGQSLFAILRNKCLAQLCLKGTMQRYVFLFEIHRCSCAPVFWPG